MVWGLRMILKNVIGLRIDEKIGNKLLWGMDGHHCHGTNICGYQKFIQGKFPKVWETM